MSTIQSVASVSIDSSSRGQAGANWWIDSTVRFPGGGVGLGDRGAVTNDTVSVAANYDVYEPITAGISDVEEGSETDHTEVVTVDHSHFSQIADNDNESAGAARQLGIIQAAMRDHQANGTFNFNDGDDQDQQDLTDESFKTSLTIEMLRDASATVATATLSRNRMELLPLFMN